MDKQLHSFIRCLIILGLLAGLAVSPLRAAAQQSGPSSYSFMNVDTVDTSWQTNQEIPASYTLAGENSNFQLYTDAETLAFKVVDKRSGYVWHSNLDAVTKDDKLNKTWTAFARSGISIDYLDPKANYKRASITAAKHTLDVKTIDQGFEAKITFTDVSISLGLIVRLEQDGVQVEVPFDSIREEDPDYKLGLLYVYPFFGATKEETIPGYMFIPDGSGSLIRFGTSTKAKNMFYGRYYGEDLGMTAVMPFDPLVNEPYRISVPVIGMVHGYHQNGYIAVIEKGASYGEIQAHPAGIITKWNFLYNAFIYNESYFQATNRSGAGVTTLQDDTNAFDVRIHYRFMTGNDSDYIGMARSYQAYLLDQGVLEKLIEPGSDIGIKLEILGGEKEKVLFWSRFIPMTTVAQADAMLTDLAIANQEVVYYGWQPYGPSVMAPRTFKLDSHLGSTAELRSLADKIQAGGGKFYLYDDPQAALRSDNSYSPRNDLAMSITKANLMGFNRNKVNYYLNLDALTDRLTPLRADAQAKLQADLALDGFGSQVYSDFKSNHFLNREAAIQAYQALLAGQRTAFYLPNDYMFGSLRAYYDMPLSNSGYVYVSDVVPFLQAVFAGYLPYYAPALNFSSNLKEDLLRQVEYGAYPSYFLSHEVTAKILNTDSNWIFTSSYQQWSEDIKQSYRWLNGLLSPVKGQAIIAREVLAEGVVAVTYANGKQIVVNYTGQPYDAGGLTVMPQDAVLKEVLP